MPTEFVSIFGYILQYGGWPVVAYGVWYLRTGELLWKRDLDSLKSYITRLETALDVWQKIGIDAVAEMQKNPQRGS